MKFPFRHIYVCLALLLASVSARAQFTLELVPLSPGTGELRFTLEPGYYYSLESSGDLDGGFTGASGWMLGDNSLVTWPIHYPISPTAGGGATVSAGDTFSLYPFDNGRTLATWGDFADAPYSALIIEDYSFLPPLLNVPATATAGSLTLLVGSLAWNPAYVALDPALLPAAQRTVLDRFTTRRAEVIAAATPGTAGPGVVIDAEKHFFRLRRMAADADGDGLDWAAEVFQFGTDPDSSDSDGDGVSDGEELARGLNPGSDDSDGDNAKDGSDAYPNDERRSEDIPVKFYGVIDLSQYQYQGQPVPAENIPDSQLTIDDENRVSWVNVGEETRVTMPPFPVEEDYTSTHTRPLTVATWQDGAMIGMKSLINEYVHTGSWNGSGYETSEVNRDITFHAVNGRGMAAGAKMFFNTAGQSVDGAPPNPPGNYYRTRTYPDGFRVPPSYTPPQFAGYPPIDDNEGYIETGGWQSISYYRISHGTATLPVVKAGIMVYGLPFTGGGGTATTREKVFRTTNAGAATVVNDTPSDEGTVDANMVFFPEENGEPGPISNTALVVLFQGDDSVSPVVLPRAVLWRASGAQVELLPFGGAPDPKAVNDSEQVVGAVKHPFGAILDERGFLGFLWSPAEGIRVFHDLLPGKFRKQLRSAVPYLITNKATDGSTQISFTADLLIDGDSPGGPATDWKSESFILTVYDDPAIDAALTHSVVSNAGTPVDYREVAVNKNGIGAGVATFPDEGDPGNGQTKPCLKIPLEFFAKNILQTGFDPPMWNDRDGKLNGATPPEPEPVGKRDQDPPDGAWPGPQWWTTVHYSGNYLRTNDNIDVYAGVGANLPAKLYARVIDPGHLNGSEVVRLVTPELNTPLVPWQTLSISTNSMYPTAATATRVTGTIGIFATPPGQPNERKLQVLHVDAMPVWIIRLRFYEVYAENVAAERLPADFKDVGPIITHLNEIYRQACIKFVADPIEELPVPYETAPADHKLNSGGTDGTVSGEQAFLFRRELPELKAINVFLLREFTSKTRLGFSKRDSWDNRCAVQTKPFETPRLLHEFRNTIAHEIGHLLNMSVHDSRNLAGAGGRRHDWGWFPGRYYWKNGNRVDPPGWSTYDSLPVAMRLLRLEASLMANTTQGLDTTSNFDWRWIRHEDWQEANKKAPEFGELDN